MDSTLQSRLHLWRQRNFPKAEAHQQLMGIVEEVGELAHHVLKGYQKIRGTEAEHAAGEVDAVGDILLFLAGFCSYRGYNMAAIYEDVAENVMKRDWIKYPDTGFPRPDQAHLGSEDVTLPSGETTRLSIDPEGSDPYLSQEAQGDRRR